MSAFAPLEYAFTFGLVVCRFGALLVALPMLSEVLPARLRVGLGLLLALATTVHLGPSVERTLAELIVAAASELGVGWSIGFCVRILFSAIEAAGQMAGVQLGLSFAGNVDPLLREEAIVTTRLLNVLAWLGFLSAGGLQTSFGVLAQSFGKIPLGTAKLLRLDALVSWLCDAMLLALRLALPVLAGMLILQVAIALMSKVVAELNPFAFAFAAMTCVGLVLLCATFDGVSKAGGDIPGRLLDALAQASP